MIEFFPFSNPFTSAIATNTNNQLAPFARKHSQMTLTTYQRPSGKCARATTRVGDVFLVYTTLCRWTSWHTSACRPVDGDVRHLRHVWPSAGASLLPWVGGFISTRSACFVDSGAIWSAIYVWAPQAPLNLLKPQLNQNQTISWSSRDLNPVEIKQGGFLLIQRASDRSALCLFIWRAIFIVYRMIQSDGIDFVSGSREKKRICVILFVFIYCPSRFSVFPNDTTSMVVLLYLSTGFDINWRAILLLTFWVLFTKRHTTCAQFFILHRISPEDHLDWM